MEIGKTYIRSRPLDAVERIEVVGLGDEWIVYKDRYGKFVVRFRDEMDGFLPLD